METIRRNGARADSVCCLNVHARVNNLPVTKLRSSPQDDSLYLLRYLPFMYMQNKIFSHLYMFTFDIFPYVSHIAEQIPDPETREFESHPAIAGVEIALVVIHSY